jgi:hypothetical protein
MNKTQECDHQWTDYGTLESGDNPRIEIEVCVRCGVQRKKQPQRSEPWKMADGFYSPPKPPKRTAVDALKHALAATDAANCSLLALVSVFRMHPDVPEKLKKMASKELTNSQRGAYLIEQLRELRQQLAAEREKVHRCEVIHQHRETIELLKEQVKTLVELLRQAKRHVARRIGEGTTNDSNTALKLTHSIDAALAILEY